MWCVGQLVCSDVFSSQVVVVFMSVGVCVPYGATVGMHPTSRQGCQPHFYRTVACGKHQKRVSLNTKSRCSLSLSLSRKYYRDPQLGTSSLARAQFVRPLHHVTMRLSTCLLQVWDSR